MKLLFDFISIQGSINGGAEYAKRILYELHQRQIELYALFDKKIPFINGDNHKYHSFFKEWVNIRDINIGYWCEENKIDLFFINIAQRYFKYNMKDIRCRVVVVIHDIVGYERYNSKIPINQPSLKKYVSYYTKRLLWSVGIYRSWRNGNDRELFLKFQSFFSQKNVEIVTVSNFSKYSLLYNIPYLRDKQIDVYYSPLRMETPPIELTIIKHLVDSQIPYFVGLNANRFNKNIKMAINVIEQISNYYLPECKIVTTGSTKSFHKNHIALPYVTDGELAYILSHAKALLYPTLIEGFGYPPLEAMRYGTPVICSNISSLPEVVGNAAITFSPLYESELYKAVIDFLNSDINQLKEKSINQFEIIKTKQISDLKSLINTITNKITNEQS